MLRFPHFLDSQLIDGGKVVSPTRLPPYTPKMQVSLTYFKNRRREQNGRELDE
jgi:hypothetical protein